MKVYEIGFEVDLYQSLMPRDKDLIGTSMLKLDGTPRASKWSRPVEAELDNVNGQMPDVYSFNCGYMMLYGRSLKVLEDKIQSGVEFLPVSWDGGSGHVVHALGNTDCIDKEKTKWIVDQVTGERVLVLEPAFYRDSLPSNLIFKIPQLQYTTYCADRDDGSESLVSLVKTHDLTGFYFKKVWESDS